MRNRLAVSLALTAILSLGGMTFGKTARTAQPQNTNSSGTMSGPATSGHSRRHHRRHHWRRHHRKAAAAANANR
jgi:hypothetical protein